MAGRGVFPQLVMLSEPVVGDGYDGPRECVATPRFQLDLQTEEDYEIMICLVALS